MRAGVSPNPSLRNSFKFGGATPPDPSETFRLHVSGSVGTHAAWLTKRHVTKADTFSRCGFFPVDSLHCTPHILRYTGSRFLQLTIHIPCRDCTAPYMETTEDVQKTPSNLERSLNLSEGDYWTPPPPNRLWFVFPGMTIAVFIVALDQVNPPRI